ncbi:MAG TPA: hypothetical protein VGQ85_03600 [Candidatus Limnocylindrales bacterium]|nr:hypothetical protein [Candidatus Limnocylindrales bacterium]
MAEPQKWVPPYISFTTLLNLLDRMRDDDGAPPQIDKSYLKGMSGGYQSQVLASMKAVGLIDKDGKVQASLTELVAAKDRDARVPLIAAMLQKFYPEPVRLGTIKATQGQLVDAFKEWGIGGDTLRKAVAFYLAAAKYADLKISTLFQVPSVAPSEGRKQPKKKPDGKPADKDDEKGDTDPKPPPADQSWQTQIEPVVLEWLKRIPAKGQPWPKGDRTTWNAVLMAMLDGIHGGE